jgi:uncharacterized repeat protein (TIGR01451 family)
LLYVRFVGPPELRGTVYRGWPQGEDLYAPFLLGLRPGYVYRIQLSNFPDDPELTLFPSLEVIGTLQIPAKFRASDHPVPIVLSDRDIDRIKAGAVITKVILIEDPKRAAPLASDRNQPLEIEVPPTQDLMAAAREQGRPVLVVRMGAKPLSQAEMIAQGVPGTMLLSYDRVLPPPARPPQLAFVTVPLFDPLLGPRCSEVECVHDGGDDGWPAGIGPGQRAGNVDPGDTVAEYTTSHDHRRLVCSNRVCLCAPRYVVARTEIVPVGHESVSAVSVHKLVQPQLQFQARVPVLQKLQNEQLEGYHGRLKPSANLHVTGLDRLVVRKVLHAAVVESEVASLIGTRRIALLTEEQRTRLVRQIEFARALGGQQGVELVDQVAGPKVIGQVEATGLITTAQEAREVTIGCEQVPCPPEKPLHLYKWADRHSAQPGDLVTFTIKYGNHGGLPIRDVAVIDSLAARLEYVAGSAQSDRDAVFTLQENAAGSVQLRWEIAGRLLPGETGLVRFQARVR